MVAPAISVEKLWKQFRLYHDKNQYLKTAILQGSRSRYEEFWAIKDVSFDVAQGSTFGIIGSNGSGKSTLLKCLTGILTPEKGSVRINGNIAALLELGAGFHPDLSGRENIFLNGAILGMTSKEISRKLDEIIDFAGLEHFIDTPVKNYSSGMTVRLGFAIAINVDPEILIIDEVLAVGDAAFQQKCLEKIEEFRSDGRTIILVSHGLGQVAQICDSVAWIEKGILKELGEARKVVSDYNALSHHASPMLPNEIGQRWGSGEISITAVEITGDNGLQKFQFQTGDRMSIEIQFLSQIALESASISVRISNLHGIEIWGTSTESNFISVPINKGHGQASLQISHLPLLDGTYDVSIVIADHAAIHEYDHWEKRLRFDVRQKSNFDSGLVEIESKWSVNS